MMIGLSWFAGSSVDHDHSHDVSTNAGGIELMDWSACFGRGLDRSREDQQEQSNCDSVWV